MISKTINRSQAPEMWIRGTLFLVILALMWDLVFGVRINRNHHLNGDCLVADNTTLHLASMKWYHNKAQNGCSRNAVMLTGHLQTFNTTFPYLKEYIFDEGPYDVYWAGPDLTYANLNGPDGDEYRNVKHSDKGNDLLNSQTQKVDSNLIDRITHGRLSGFGMYHQNMSIFRNLVQEQCLPPNFTAHYPNNDLEHQRATYSVARTMETLYNIQEAAKFLSGQSCKYERILWTRPDMMPHFYFREPLTSNREVCGFNLPWTLMFDADGNQRPERGEFCDMAYWTSMETVENTLVDTINHALQAWRYNDVGFGHTESTIRHVLAFAGRNTILKCPMFPFDIQRNDMDPPKLGFGYTSTTMRYMKPAGDE